MIAEIRSTGLVPELRIGWLRFLALHIREMIYHREYSIYFLSAAISGLVHGMRQARLPAVAADVSVLVSRDHPTMAGQVCLCRPKIAGNGHCCARRVKGSSFL